MRTSFLCAALVAATWAAHHPPQAPSLSAGQWRDDLRYFSRELERRHKNLFHSVSREDFARAVRQLDSAVPLLQPHEVIVRLHQLAALVGDGHTGVHLPAYFSIYPIAVYWFGSELRVTAASPDYQRALGARVTHIGGKPIAAVEMLVRTMFPSVANENEWYAMSTSPAFMVRPEVLHALGVITDPAGASWGFEDDQGKQFSLDLVPVAVPPPGPGGVVIQGLRPVSPVQPLFRQRPTERFWFTWLADTKTVYVNWRGYQSLGDNAGRLFRFIDSTSAERLVIDIRQNGGGDFFEGRRHIVQPLVQHRLNQAGKLYVIIGRRTYSAAMVNAIDFKKMTRATLVGEPIGERPNSYSENDEMTLPNSKIVVSYSTRYYKFLDEDVPAFLPDIRIDPGWPEWRAGRDPVLEWILGRPH